MNTSGARILGAFVEAGFHSARAEPVVDHSTALRSRLEGLVIGPML